METYKEYPIRCKTCNEQIACFSDNYEILIDSGYSIEEALDELSITAPCSRITMMAPTIVAFNMENREVIEGFKSVDAADEETAQNESISHPIFNQCLNIQTGSVAGAPIPMGLTLSQPRNLMNTQVPQPGTVLSTTELNLTQSRTPARPVTTELNLSQPRILPNTVGLTLGQSRINPNAAGLTLPRPNPNTPGLPLALNLSQPRIIPGNTNILPLATKSTTVSGLQTIGMSHPTLRIQAANIPTSATSPAKSTAIPITETVAPIIPGIDIKSEIGTVNNLIGIPVKVPETINTKFQEPTMVGVPTINTDPLLPQVQVYVGAGKYVHILNGRTYLAQ